MPFDNQSIPAYTAAPERYDEMLYRRCGRSGLKLPAISLGLWHNFGHDDNFTTARQICRTAFDLGITHFDLANNYGPPYGAAEETFGRILDLDLRTYRDQLIISSKAGYDMWAGPYGDFGSRKYLMASLDQSLKRMGLDYVDIFYHHRPDPETPLEETMRALADIVKQGKALYVGVSNYPADLARQAAVLLDEYGTKLLIHQPRYNMLDRWVEEDGLLDVLEDAGAGAIAFSPLEQGILTDKYHKGLPADSRAVKDGRYLNDAKINEKQLDQSRKLNEIALSRGQTLAQMAIAWLLKDERLTSVLVGVSRPQQVIDNVNALKRLEFSEEELAVIGGIIKS